MTSMRDDLAVLLSKAAAHGREDAVRSCLACGADADAMVPWTSRTPLCLAASGGHTTCLQLLLAAGANASMDPKDGSLPPLCAAAAAGSSACLAALLAAGARPPLSPSPAAGTTAWHLAALQHNTSLLQHNTSVLQLLLAAAPAGAWLQNAAGQTPLQLALASGCTAAARCLLRDGPLPPAGEVLAALCFGGEQGAPLYATLAARQSLTPAEWAQVPAPCPGLGDALPAVLHRSAAEAAQLVARLPIADGQRLRTAALSLNRVQRQRRAELPTPLVWRLLALSAAT